MALSGCFVKSTPAEQTSGTAVSVGETSPSPSASDPAMDLMPVIDVVGMGPFEAEAALNDAGILTVIHVDAADAGRVPIDTTMTLASTSLDEPCEGEPDTP